MKLLISIIPCFLFIVSCNTVKDKTHEIIQTPKEIYLRHDYSSFDKTLDDEQAQIILGNPRSVKYTNFTFSQKDSAFIPDYKTGINNYRNSVFNIDSLGRIKNTTTYSGPDWTKKEERKYTYSNVSENSFIAHYEMFTYMNDSLERRYPIQSFHIENGKQTKRVDSSNGSEYNSTFKYTTSQHQEMIEIATVDHINGTVIDVVHLTFEYDQSKRLSRKQRKSDNDESTYTFTEYEYNDDNSQWHYDFTVSKKKITSLGIRYIKLNELGHLIEQKNYSLADVFDSNYMIENKTEVLNRYMQSIKENKAPFIARLGYHTKYNYEYDDQGNWITKTIIDQMSDSKKMLKREITYF